MSSTPPSQRRSASGAVASKSSPPARADTRTRILDAAEALFVEMGFAGTSLRAITARADVNLAAANYHFGSKEGLLGEVVHRRVAHVNLARVRMLDRLEADAATPSVEQVLQAFFAPIADSEVHSALPWLIARLYGEPESIARPLIEREFGPTAGRFIAALQRALPEIDPDLVAWRYHFVVGAMIHLLAFERPAGTAIIRPPTSVALGQLADFAAAGLRQGLAADAAAGNRR